MSTADKAPQEPTEDQKDAYRRLALAILEPRTVRPPRHLRIVD